MHRLIIAVLYFKIVTSQVGFVRASREKRVISGSPYLDIEKSDYLSFRYFVWIGNGHNCDVPVPDKVKDQAKLDKNFELDLGLGWIAYHWGIVCAPRPNNLRCTGSLLTPFLVQTACHCVVQFYLSKSTTGRAVPLSPSENRFSVHSAARFVDYLPDGVYSKKFVVHPKCTNEEKRSNLKNDYALIVLEHPLNPVQGIFAPLYRVNDLARIWTGIMSKRKVCLNIGYGDDGSEKNKKTKSSSLRHGWVTTLDYLSCARLLEAYVTFNTSYDQQITWFCTDTLGVIPQASGSGDSGGPVTCDNEYAGIVCEGTKVFNKQMSTAFSVYENAYEYREELSRRIYEIYGPEDALRDYRPTSNPFREMYFEGNVTSTGLKTSNGILASMALTALLHFHVEVAKYNSLL